MSESETIDVRLSIDVIGFKAAFERASRAMTGLAVAYWRGMPWPAKLRFALRHPRSAWRISRLARK